MSRKLDFTAFLLFLGASALVMALSSQALEPTPAGEITDPDPFCMIRPSPGLTARCRVIEVYDGDTVTVEMRIPVRVRLLDCWAPELREDGGEESREHLDWIAGLEDGMLWVPWGDARRAGDVWSFNRILGHVWIDGSDESLSERQVLAGHATIERQ